MSSPSWLGGAIHDRSRTSEDRKDVATTGGLGIGLRSEIAMTHTCRASACSIHFNGIFFPIAAAPRSTGRQCPIAGESSAAAPRWHVRSLTIRKIFPCRIAPGPSRLAWGVITFIAVSLLPGYTNQDVSRDCDGL